MKGLQIFILVVVILVLLLTGADYLAMRSIQRNYISQTAMAQANLLESGKNLPDWVNASFEWTFLLGSMIAKATLVLVLAITWSLKLWAMQRNIHRLSSATPSPPTTTV